MFECDNCGDSEGSLIVGNQGGEYCSDCANDMPCCDDCDITIEDGDYHLCEPCLANREAKESF